MRRVRRILRLPVTFAAFAAPLCGGAILAVTAVGNADPGGTDPSAPPLAQAVSALHPPPVTATALPVGD